MREEMDLVSDCQGKLGYFRIKELKDVLSQLGLSKQGKKQDLVDKILSLLAVEEVSATRATAKKNLIGRHGVAKIIDDAYRKIRNLDPADLETKGQSCSDISSHKQEEEFEKSISSDAKICCPCGSSLPSQFMIQCGDPGCEVQQHISCVVIPDNTVEGIPPVPQLFYCESCRIIRGDPFWETVRHLLSPVKLVASSIPTDGTNPLLNMEKTFELTRDDKDLLQNMEYDVQAWCILQNDSVSFRMQWPLYVDLQVNGIVVRAVNRAGSQLLGANGRDDGPLITLYLLEGINKISISGCDARVFCFGIRLVRQRTLQQVLNLIPKEADGENFEDALARVCRCIGGKVATESEDTDSDVEVVADSVTVNLRCPMSGSRMKVAARFKPCAHMGCFDLEIFVELNQRSRKWQCPICVKNYSFKDIIIDPYFNRITTMMRHCGEDITEINVKSDGSWSAKTGGEFSDLEEWHFPGDSIYSDKDEATSHLESLIQMKLEDNLEEHGNQDCGGPINLAIHDENGIISIPHHSPPTFGILNSCHALEEDADIIVISDSEGEKDHVSSLSALPSITDSFVEDPYPNRLGVFNGIGSESGMSPWPYSLGSQAGPAFQLFGPGADVFVDLEHTSDSILAQINGKAQTSRLTVNSGGGEPSMESFLPTQPPDMLEQSIMGQQPPGSFEDWISLRVGSKGESVHSDFGAHVLAAATNEPDFINPNGANEAATNTDMNEEARSEGTNIRKFSGGPFSYPRQPRTVRQRTSLPVDSDLVDKLGLY